MCLQGCLPRETEDRDEQFSPFLPHQHCLLCHCHTKTKSAKTQGKPQWKSAVSSERMRWDTNTVHLITEYHTTQPICLQVGNKNKGMNLETGSVDPPPDSTWLTHQRPAYGGPGQAQAMSFYFFLFFLYAIYIWPSELIIIIELTNEHHHPNDWPKSNNNNKTCCKKATGYKHTSYKYAAAVVGY